MMFRRKSKVEESHSKTGEPRTERRRQYRIPQSKKHPLSATLKLGTDVFQADFIDVSVHGVGMRVASGRAEKMAVGDVIEITIMSLTHGKVTTPGKLIHREADGSHARLGFEFVNIGDLYAQLDAFYSRIFNRRRAVRVRPALDRKLTVALRWASREIKANVTNMSETGLGIALPTETAVQLEGVDNVEIAFKLPGAAEPLVGRAFVRNKNAVSGQVVYGLMFDFDRASTLATRRAEIGVYVEKRAEEISKWEASWAEAR